MTAQDTARDEVYVPLTGPHGEPRGRLRIAVLPHRRGVPILRDATGDPNRSPELEPLQIVEGEEYIYAVELEGAPTDAAVRVDPQEVFSPDTIGGRTGRLRPREYVGRLVIRIFLGDQLWGSAAVEVVSTKIDYLSHYRWMLRDLAETCAELILERFAPTQQWMLPQWTGDAITLYGRFALLRHLLNNSEMEAAIQQVLTRPHRAWIERAEPRPPGRGVPAGSGVARNLAVTPGSCRPWPAGPIPYVPERIPVRRTEETLDTAENRFVLFALRRWRDLAAQVREALEREERALPSNNPVRRGLAEATLIQDWLDAIIASSTFADVGEMTHLPASSQVLQKRAGYREIFRAFLLVEAAAALAWEGGDDVYGAGQRNVATLYEYWAYLRLARIVAGLCDHAVMESLFTLRDDKLVITLKKGRTQVVKGEALRLGRRLRIELYFNKDFTPKSGQTWTVPLRPDMSLCVVAEPGLGGHIEPVWLHFDAKYRIDGFTQLLGARADLPDSEGQDKGESSPAQGHAAVEAEGLGAHQADLLKMHVYRDAIRRSAGAYVIYPGTDETPQLFREYHEILPGLGAFALRPTAHGEAEGEDTLTGFLRDVLDHVASQATQHERARFWIREAFHAYSYTVGAHKATERAGTAADAKTAPSMPGPAVPAVDFLPYPPADTRVLLGYVRSAAQREWIRRHGLYNLRADTRRGSVGLRASELGVELVILYSQPLNLVELWRVDGEPEIYTRERMMAMGYPHPAGAVYFCLPIRLITPKAQPSWLTPALVQQVAAVANAARGRPAAAPVAVSWLDIAVQARSLHTSG